MLSTEGHSLFSKTNRRYKILLAKYLVHKHPYTMQIFVADLYEDASRLA